MIYLDDTAIEAFTETFDFFITTKKGHALPDNKYIMKYRITIREIFDIGYYSMKANVIGAIKLDQEKGIHTLCDTRIEFVNTPKMNSGNIEDFRVLVRALHEITTDKFNGAQRISLRGPNKKQTGLIFN